MKFARSLSFCILTLAISHVETMAITCPSVSEAPQSIRCIGNGNNYSCKYISRLWHGEFNAPFNITEKAEDIKLLGHYGSDINSCRYSVQTSPTESVSYILTFKELQK